MRQDYYFETEPFEIYPEVDAYEVFDTGLAGETWTGEVNRQRSKNVRSVQNMLNQVMNLRLPVDGILGPATRSAIRDFQRREGLPVDGIVRLETKQALVRARSRAAAGSTQPVPAEEEQFLGTLWEKFTGCQIEDRTHLTPKSKRKRQRDPSTVYALVLHQMAFSRGNDPTDIIE